MPELPEVETIVRELNRRLSGKTLIAITIYFEGCLGEDLDDIPHRLPGQSLKSVKRRGKAILLNFEEDTLMIHLMMTGSLTLGEELSPAHTRLVLNFEEELLYFTDPRKFGRVRLLKDGRNPFLDHLGVDALSDKLTSKYFYELLQQRDKSIKACLLDQHLIAGVGNIYCDEALFLAGIHPATPAQELSEKEARELLRALKKVLRTGIREGGATRQNYRNAKGERGNYLEQAWVYGRQNQPCYRCGRAIEKIQVATRGTHYCPNCQGKKPRIDICCRRRK